MNFIRAIQHASIGFLIRRKAWQNFAVLRLVNYDQLYWINGIQCSCHILGSDKGTDLMPEDLAATDWTTLTEDWQGSSLVPGDKS